MRQFRPISVLASLVLVFAMSVAGRAQTAAIPSSSFAATDIAPDFSTVRAVAHLSPDSALATYERGMQEQASELAGYTATSVIDAELPQSSQKAEFELKRHYAAPSVLEFT